MRKSKNYCLGAFVLTQLLLSQAQPLAAQADSSIWEMKMKDVLKSTATKQPTLTGGAVTISVATLATSTIIMAMEISAKKEKNESIKTYLDSSIRKLREYSDSLMSHADLDKKVFHHFLEISKLPRATKAEQQLRDSLYKVALLEATIVPLRAARYMTEILQLAVNLAPHCNGQMKSDLGAGVEIIAASTKGILLVANGNIQSLPVQDKGKWENESNNLLESAEKYKLMIMEHLK